MRIKELKIDNEVVEFIESDLVVFRDEEGGLELILEIIVGEDEVEDYNDKGYEIEFVLESGTSHKITMATYGLTYKDLPYLCFTGDINGMAGFEEIEVIQDKDMGVRYSPIADITLEDIRKVKMPIDEVDLELRLPRDQAEWLYQKKASLMNYLKK